jgi:hippurate hydrolase
MPEVTLNDAFLPATRNSPELAARIIAAFKEWFAPENVRLRRPSMAGEDFGLYGLTDDKIPIFMFDVGGVRPEDFKANRETGKPLAGLHSAFWAPLPEPTIRTGVTAMTAAVLDLMNKAELTR